MGGVTEQPCLTATVKVVRSPDDWEGILTDMLLRGEATILVRAYPDPSLVYVDQVESVRLEPEPGAYSLSALTTLRGGFTRSPALPQYPRH